MPPSRPPRSLPGGSGAAVASVAPCVKFEVEFLNVKKASEMNDPDATKTALSRKKLAKSKLVLLKNAKQYVNLPKEERWRKEAAVKVDRLGRKPRIVVRFAQKEVRQVEVQIFYTQGPVYDARRSDNVTYSHRERGRAAGSSESLGPRVYSTDSNGIVIIDDLKINAAGGNKYWVEAKDVASGIVKHSSATIQTWRLLWLQVLRYADLRVNYSMIVKAYSYAFIEINTKRYKPLSDENLEVLIDRDAGYYRAVVDSLADRTGRETSPYNIVLILVRINCANIDSLDLPSTAMPASKRKITLSSFPPIYSKDRFANKNWLRSATFFPASGAAAVDISAACDVKKYEGSSFASTIIVDRRKFPPSPQAREDGQIEINVVTVSSATFSGDRMLHQCTVAVQKMNRAGKNLPFVNRKRGDFESGPDCTCIHEIGHSLNMVTDGSRNLPDNRGNHTRNRIHGIGDHCLPVPAPSVITGTHCVMYGIGKPGRLETFCPHCEIELRKMNLSR